MSEQAAEFLASVPLFSHLSPEELRRVGDVTREQRYGRGDTIVSAAEPGDALFVVRTGRVKVVLHADGGREAILGVLGVGEHFGELSLIDGQPRSASVVALDLAVLLVLRREDFRRQVETSPALAWTLLAELSRRLRQADGKIGGLALLDVPGRIARLLIELSAEHGSDTMHRPLTHQLIAQMIGATRETVSRVLRDFEAADWIAVERRRITVRDRAALTARAQLATS